MQNLRNVFRPREAAPPAQPPASPAQNLPAPQPRVAAINGNLGDRNTQQSAPVQSHQRPSRLDPNQRELLFQHELEQWVHAGPEAETTARQHVATAIQEWRSTPLLNERTCIHEAKITCLPRCIKDINNTTLCMKGNSIEVISALPRNLKGLYITNHPHLSELPENLPVTLTDLSVFGTPLTTLPSLPDGLTRLNVSHAALTSLPPLPEGLTELDVSNTRLSSLPPLPEGLTRLDVSNTRLSSLPPLPEGLTELDVGSTGLTSLLPLPEGLTILIVRDTPLTSLPSLPEGLTCLDVSDTPLSSLPSLPEGLERIYFTPRTYEALPPALTELFVGVDGSDLSTMPNLIHRIREWQQQNPHLVSDYVPPVVHNTISPRANLMQQREASPIPQIIAAPPRVATPPLEEFADPRFHDINAAELALGYELQRRMDLRDSGEEAVGESSSAGPSSRDTAPRTARYSQVNEDGAQLSLVMNDAELAQAREVQRLYELQNSWSSPTQTIRPAPTPLRFARPASPVLRVPTPPPPAPASVVQTPQVDEFGMTAEDREQALQLQAMWELQASLAIRPAPTPLRFTRPASPVRRIPTSPAPAPAPVVQAPQVDEFGMTAEDREQALQLQAMWELQASLALSDTASEVSVEVEPAASAIPRRASGNWRFDEAEDSAADFNEFQGRLSGTAAYGNSATRVAFVDRVNDLVAAMDASAELRGLCFVIAKQVSCGDGVVLQLHKMERARFDCDVTEGVQTLADLYSVGRRVFALDAVNTIANRRIQTLEARGVRIDQAEIELAYQTELAAPLNLPVIAQSMLYRGAANVSQRHLNEAEREVRRQLEGSAPINFLVSWGPWQRAIEREHPEAFASLRAMHERRRNALVNAPSYMNSQEYKVATDSIGPRESEEITAEVMTATLEFLEENPTA